MFQVGYRRSAVTNSHFTSDPSPHCQDRTWRFNGAMQPAVISNLDSCRSAIFSLVRSAVDRLDTPCRMRRPTTLVKAMSTTTTAFDTHHQPHHVGELQGASAEGGVGGPLVMEGTGMNYEECRLMSFRKWPVSAPVSADRLARAGFFYLGRDDAVRCFSCGGILENWNYGDDVMKKHRKSFPSCHFIQRQSHNVPFLKSSMESKLHMQLLESMDSGFDRSISRPTTPSSSIHPLMSSREEAKTHSRYGVVDISCRSLRRGTSITSTMTSDAMDVFQDGVDMKQEENRRKSYKNWTSSHVQPENLAAAGFFYTSFQDRVRCAFCGGILGMWQPGDDPFAEHEKHFPWCSFGKKGYCSDYSSTQSSPTDSANGNDVCGSLLSAPRITPSKYPCSPYLANYQVRLGTYRNWPPNRIQTPELLAFAGFFFTGVNDNVRCFHCDGGLRCWEPADEAWVEHAKWFPQCPYLQEVKGADYVESIQKAAAEVVSLAESAPPVHRRKNSISSPAGSPCAPDEEMVIRRVLEMGFPQPSVELALQERRARGMTAEAFRNVEELINAVLEVENRKKRPEGAIGRPVGGLFAKLRSLSRDSDKAVSVEKLAEENRILKQQRRCKICFDKEVNTVLLPCGHLMACENCAPQLRTCGICRVGIRGTLKTFFS
ncbi:E3 ubiquitin-protein ligase XIAP [Hypsibius exemplaris]|uniref:E3 ubiquitin-protein ligase XIAP n=1 Tax=Hypsibius exemplaris TaxID=2072580 RepID=A0A1W0X450_HYPEX|nr:E3 ubiquitin-protein ligase XIAP [Hypsibius exemplaris]